MMRKHDLTNQKRKTNKEKHRKTQTQTQTNTNTKMDHLSKSRPGQLLISETLLTVMMRRHDLTNHKTKTNTNRDRYKHKEGPFEQEPGSPGQLL